MDIKYLLPTEKDADRTELAKIPNVHPIKMDVTNKEQIDEAFKE